MVYNTRNGGWLAKALQNIKAGEKQRAEKAIEASETNEGSEQPQEIVVTEERDETLKADMLFLKTEIVTEDNIEEFRMALKRTIEYRKSMMPEMKMDLPDHFSCFFTHPILVSNFIQICLSYKIRILKFFLLM